MFSGTAVAGLKFSNCLEYLLLAGGVGIARVAEFRGRGDPVDEGVYESRPAKESYRYQYGTTMASSLTYSIPLLLVGVGFRPQFLNVEKQPHSIAYLVDAHFLQHRLIHLQQVLAIDVVLPKYLLVITTVHTDQPVTNPFFIPILC